MTARRQSVGKWGESLAATYLETKGYEIYRRNFRTPYGEIDLVALDCGVTVFVEVKARTTRTFGFPEVSITPTKREHMLSAAQYFIANHPQFENDWRIDVIAIQGDPSGPPPEIVHYENALTGS